MEATQYPYSALATSLTVTECMHRLKQVINASTIKEVVHWLGVSYSHYKNWKQRCIIPYSLIVPRLLQVGYSVDWLFAPGVQLYYPKPLVCAPNKGAQVKEQQERYRFYMKAVHTIEPILMQNQLKNIEHNRKELVDVYFNAYEGWVSLDSCLNAIARATAINPVTLESAREINYVEDES